MKQFILVIISILFLFNCAATTTATIEQMNHEFIKEYPNINKDVIFDRTMQWIANNFKSAKQVKEYSDKEAGKIVGNGSFDFRPDGSLIDVTQHFTINIDIKDDKARYRFINLWHNIGNISAEMPDIQEWHLPVDKKFNLIIDDLSAATEAEDDF